MSEILVPSLTVVSGYQKQPVMADVTRLEIAG